MGIPTNKGIRRINSRRFMHGVSMIEVLVTTLVLALGILGTSALQITGLKGTDAAHYRTVATFIANEMADRIRANPEGMISGDYETNPDAPISCTPISESTINCNVNSCTPSQLALFDKTQLTCGHVRRTGDWRTANKGGVTGSLPGGTLSISCGTSGCGGNTDHTITVSWNERADHEGQNTINTAVVLTITP